MAFYEKKMKWLDGDRVNIGSKGGLGKLLMPNKIYLISYAHTCFFCFPKISMNFLWLFFSCILLPCPLQSSPLFLVLETGWPSRMPISFYLIPLTYENSCFNNAPFFPCKIRCVFQRRPHRGDVCVFFLQTILDNGHLPATSHYSKMVVLLWIWW